MKFRKLFEYPMTLPYLVAAIITLVAMVADLSRYDPPPVTLKDRIFQEDHHYQGLSRVVALPPMPDYGPDLFCYYVDDICEAYPQVDPAVVKAIIWQESRFAPECKSDGGYSVGLMQVSTRWHMDRAYSLGVTDLMDPYSNILVGVDYLNDLITYNGDLGLSLMLYNMNHSDAYRLYKSGRLSNYATSVMAKAEEYRNGGA